MSEPPLIPIPLRVHLAHAVVQSVADEAGVDLLHIKGPAATAEVRPVARRSSDADVLVRPEQADRLFTALRSRGWTEVNRLFSGGLFEHSANWYHAQLGQLDVHIRFPGICLASSDAFEVLWLTGTSVFVAHVPCNVPSIDAHRLILLMHAARNPVTYDTEAHSIWAGMSEDERNQAWVTARLLKAEVALAAAIGGLDDYHDRPEYPFWAMSSGHIDAPRGPRRFLAKLRATPPTEAPIYRGIVGYTTYVINSGAARAEGPRSPGGQLRNLASWLRQWLQPRPRPRP